MKHSFTSVLLLTVVGFAVLVAGATYFGAPLFGWVIMLSIFAVFLVEQGLVMKLIRQVSKESEVLDSLEKRGIHSVAGDGVVANRIALVQNLLSKKIPLDSPMAHQVLNSKVEIKVPSSSGGTVILLGLMGTFFGLMASIATAGGAMDNSTTQGTLDTIQHLFQNMKGIFGTSLCGLFAALILNGSRNLFLNLRDDFMARLDCLTLSMQEGSLDSEDKTGLERLFETVENNLLGIAQSVEKSLTDMVQKVGDELSAITLKLDQNLSHSVEKISENVNTSVQKVSREVTSAVNTFNQSFDSSIGKISEGVKDAFVPMENSVKSLSASVEMVPSKLEDKLNGLSIVLGSSLDKLSEGTVNAQKEGLDTLKNVALQVAEQSQKGSVELSQDVSEKLAELSNHILESFQKLSETSATLLEAQKALTESIDTRVVKENEASQALGGNIVETAELMRVNQSELSANLEMLRAGLETILEKLNGDTQEHEEEETFVEHLNQSLEAFHERATEVLMENAVKTQEILLEVLEQTQRVHHGVSKLTSEEPKVEG